MAHLEAVEGRHRFIILIMLEDINVNDLPDEMQKYVKTYTYIDAIKLNNEKDKELFKKKLLYAMPQKPIKQLKADEGHIEMDDIHYPKVPAQYKRVYRYQERYAEL